MAIVAHLVQKVNVGGGADDVRNKIKSVIIAIDDLVQTTDALIQAQAVVVSRANGQDLPDGYFDTNRAIATTWDAANDITIIGGDVLAEVIA